MFGAPSAPIGEYRIPPPTPEEQALCTLEKIASQGVVYES